MTPYNAYTFENKQWRTQEFVLECTPKSLGSEYKHSTQAGFLIVAQSNMRQRYRHIPVVTH